MQESDFAFLATADIDGQRGSFPDLRLFCRICGRALYGDWEYNFTDNEAHAACVRDGRLYVIARINGLHVYEPLTLPPQTQAHA